MRSCVPTITQLFTTITVNVFPLRYQINFALFYLIQSDPIQRGEHLPSYAERFDSRVAR